MKHIEVITFDGDGTLWNFRNAMRKSLQKIVDILKKEFPEEAQEIDIDILIEIRNEVAEKSKGKFINLEEIRRRSFDETLKRMGVFSEEFSRYLSTVYFQKRYRQVKIYEDTIPVITELRKHYRIGIISNGNTYPEKIGLCKNLFDFLVYAEQAGVSKPDPEIFHIAMEKANTTAGQMLHVGDSVEDDIIPALKLGIHAVLITRDEEKTEEPTNLPPEVQIIKTLYELRDLPILV